MIKDYAYGIQGMVIETSDGLKIQDLDSNIHDFNADDIDIDGGVKKNQVIFFDLLWSKKCTRSDYKLWKPFSDFATCQVCGQKGDYETFQCVKTLSVCNIREKE